MSAQTFLLEIGVENLPASYIEPAFKQLGVDTTTFLEASRLEFDSVYTTGTPRRLVLIVEGLVDKQGAAEETVTGPPVARAYDEEGNPTKAAQGFARSLGIAVDKLAPIETPKGEFLGVVRKLPRKNTAVLLRENVSNLIAGLRFPKTMKWEASGARFARPVRWIVSLYGNKPVKVSFADVSSGNRTCKRPWMKGESLVVRSADAYAAVMKKLDIIVDHEKRREKIQHLATTAAARLGLTLIEDDALLTELAFMTEDPRVLVGGFDTEYLKLPSEIVTTAMRSHQRYLALRNEKKKLSPHFITFTDTKSTGPAAVRRGNEKVLRARLEDALFYWNEDIRRGMDGLADELDRIVFIEGLGTIGEKTARIAIVARSVNAAASDRAIDDSTIDRAARLAKADIGSEMVKDGKEFTKLQGLMGSFYAHQGKESKEIVAAIRDHYAPRTPSDRVPRSALGRWIGVADRIDTIVGCFAVGLIPSGSQDPYALRRNANGLIRIIADQPDIDLLSLLDASLSSYEQIEATPELRDTIIGFLKGRVVAYLKDQRVPYDVADAVIPVSWTRPGTALIRARAISAMKGDSVFERLITGVKRVGNIIDEGNRRYGTDWASIFGALEGSELDTGIQFTVDHFEDPTEGALHMALLENLPAIKESDDSGDLGAALAGLSNLAGPIDNFFDAVLVNAENPAIKTNRHGLLAVIFAVFARYADFSSVLEKTP